MSLTTVFSVLGNNSSLAPIILKDSIDNMGRVGMAYSEGKKASKQCAMHDGRERFIEENVTSLVWMGGIPFLKALFNKTVINKAFGFEKVKGIKGNIFANTHDELLGDGVQSLKNNLKNIKPGESAVFDTVSKQAEKILANPEKFKKLQTGKRAFSTLIPLFILAYVLPKLNQDLTKKIYTKQKQSDLPQNTGVLQDSLNNKHIPPTFSAFIPANQAQKKDISFGGIGKTFTDIFNDPVKNMAILDGGIAAGRIATSRNWVEAVEKAIKEAGVIFFIYLGGKTVAKGFEKLTKKFGLPTVLDSKIIEDKDFQKNVIKAAKDSKFKKELLSFNPDSEEAVVKFIDEELKHSKGEFKNYTLKAAEKLKLINVIRDTAKDAKGIEHKVAVRNPLKLVDHNEVIELNKSIANFVEEACKSGNVEKFIKKAKNAKRFSIIANLAICSISTAYILPKIQYIFREKASGTAAMPGLKAYDKQMAKMQVNA